MTRVVLAAEKYPPQHAQEARNMLHTHHLRLPGYTIAEAACALGVTEMTVYRLAKKGELPVYRDISGRLRVEYGELFAYIRDREIEEIAEGIEAMLKE